MTGPSGTGRPSRARWARASAGETRQTLPNAHPVEETRAWGRGPLRSPGHRNCPARNVSSETGTWTGPQTLWLVSFPVPGGQSMTWAPRGVASRWRGQSWAQRPQLTGGLGRRASGRLSDPAWRYRLRPRRRAGSVEGTLAHSGPCPGAPVNVSSEPYTPPLRGFCHPEEEGSQAG